VLTLILLASFFFFCVGLETFIPIPVLFNALKHYITVMISVADLD
jgi:hypothetical protein